MTRTSNQIVFFGSGPVAAKSLSYLSEHCKIEAVITKHSTLSEMQLAAINAHVFTVANKTDLDELVKTKAFDSKLAVLIDFGIIVNQAVIDSFPLGIINSHFSLLPQWRGADPISFAILSGQKTTGVSLMQLTAGMDEGPVFAQGKLEITPETTSTSLTAKLIDLSDALLKDFIPLYLDGKIEPRPQEEVASVMGIEVTPTYSRKLTKEDGRIDWTKPAEVIEREIRAYIEWPRSYTKLGPHDVIIKKAHVVPSDFPDRKPGDITVQKEAKTLTVKAGKASLRIEVLQPAGKKEMPVEAFLAGYRLDA
jgi:methionyl-tRNA formyltransferase